MSVASSGDETPEDIEILNKSKVKSLLKYYGVKEPKGNIKKLRTELKSIIQEKRSSQAR